ncbi:hypothetical protein KTAU_31700 [Thermogemmatispora aurantia]|jgi:hypothetical protein|nr:hypothetical protein KTAU_31700 [Thermogemmatispora aurantia]
MQGLLLQSSSLTATLTLLQQGPGILLPPPLLESPLLAAPVGSLAAGRVCGRVGRAPGQPATASRLAAEAKLSRHFTHGLCSDNWPTLSTVS